MYLSITNVKPLKNHRLLLTFENNEKRVFYVTPYLNAGLFSELSNPSMFNSVRVNFDSIEWANHADLDSELLYQNSKKYKD